ncbi:hypothetical protein MN608_01390 [Microdochium nivale]|nr:hypothetical protein MN608_01390 [Microdochium nivale]
MTARRREVMNLEVEGSSARLEVSATQPGAQHGARRAPALGSLLQPLSPEELLIESAEDGVPPTNRMAFSLRRQNRNYPTTMEVKDVIQQDLRLELCGAVMRQKKAQKAVERAEESLRFARIDLEDAIFAVQEQRALNEDVEKLIAQSVIDHVPVSAAMDVSNHNPSQRETSTRCGPPVSARTTRWDAREKW